MSTYKMGMTRYNSRRGTQKSAKLRLQSNQFEWIVCSKQADTQWRERRESWIQNDCSFAWELTVRLAQQGCASECVRVCFSQLKSLLFCLKNWYNMIHVSGNWIDVIYNYDHWNWEWKWENVKWVLQIARITYGIAHTRHSCHVMLRKEKHARTRFMRRTSNSLIFLPLLFFSFLALAFVRIVVVLLNSYEYMQQQHLCHFLFSIART